MVKARLVGNTELIYDVENVSDLATANNVTECFALAKLEVRRRNNVMAFSRDVMNRVNRMFEEQEKDENEEKQEGS